MREQGSPKFVTDYSSFAPGADSDNARLLIDLARPARNELSFANTAEKTPVHLGRVGATEMKPQPGKHNEYSPRSPAYT
jgi:hypothetical protein